MAQERGYLRLIDTQTPGPRNDVTPLFGDAQAFIALVEDLSEPFLGMALDYVAGIDALGFILGAAMSFRLGVGFVPVRKGGKLPVGVDCVELVDYTRKVKSLELRKGAIHPGARVLIVDEWLETGAQVAGAVDLVEKQGGVILGIAAIQIDDCPQTQRLRARYFCHSVWEDRV